MAEDKMVIDAHEAHTGPTEAMQQDNVTENPGGQSRHGRPDGYVWGPACNYPLGSNTCLTITYVAFNNYDILVGIDIYMPRDHAQRLIDAASDRRPLKAYLMGDDGNGSNNRRLFEIPNIWTRVVDSGLSAEFKTRRPRWDLDEDYGPSRDEVYALVVLRAPGPAEHHFTSGRIDEAF